MVRRFLVVVCSVALASSVIARAESVRTYYIAAEEVDWNYAPAGRNLISGKAFTREERLCAERGITRIGSVYRKAVYRQYTDATFTKKVDDPRWSHFGILGPVIHAEVGDTIHVVFRNNTSIACSMHPHGVFYEKSSEGAAYDDGDGGAGAGDSIEPGATYTYEWLVPERAGPAAMDVSSVLWMYHSHINEPEEVFAGLVGPLVVSARGKARADGSPVDVDREIFTLFMIADENQSPYLDENIRRFTNPKFTVNKDDGDFIESNLKHSINGYIFGNVPALTMRKGEHVRWYLIGMGNEADLHTPHWHGNAGVSNNMRMDSVELLPGSMKIIDFEPDDRGTWLFHCHVSDHILAGMLARYTVE